MVMPRMFFSVVMLACLGMQDSLCKSTNTNCYSPATSLQLQRLQYLGCVNTQGQNIGCIEDSCGETYFVKVGDKLEAGKAEILAIDPERIMLSRGARHVALEF